MHEPLGWKDSQKALAANLSDRYHALDRLEKYAAGTQYEGRGLAHWLDDDVPLLERAPCVVDPIVARALASYADLMFGDRRWPALSSKPAEAQDVFDSRLALSETDSAVLDKAIAAIVEQAKIRVAAVEALGAAQTARSVAAICSVRDGRMSVEIQPAKSATPSFDAYGRVARLELRYPYVEQYRTARGERGVRTVIYRRVIDTQADTTYLPALASEHGADPEWRADPSRTFAHGYGFCPVVWYTHGKVPSAAGEVDGIALHDAILDELDAYARSLSQHHRAALYCGDPQWAEYGVDPDYNPAAPGRKAAIPMASYADESPDVRAQNERWRSPPGGGADPAGNKRRKGCGVVWRYTSPETKAELFTLPSGALEPIQNDGAQLKTIIAQAMAFVDLSPDAVRNLSTGRSELSGRTIEWLYKPQTNACDKLRTEFGERWLVPVLGLLLRIALHHARTRSAGALYLPALPALAGLLARFELPSEDGGTIWFQPHIALEWGDYFQKADEDRTKINDAVRDDFEAGIITHATAVEKIAAFYGIEDPAAYAEAAKGDAGERQGSLHSALRKLERMNDAGGEDTGDVPPASPPGNGRAARGRAGAAA